MAQPGSLETQNRDDLLQTTRRLLVELSALSSRITAVQEIAAAINRSLNLEDILEIVGRQAKWLLDFDHCSVFLVEEGDAARLKTLFGESDQTLYENLRQFADNAIASRQSQLIRDSWTAAPAHPFRSQIIIPLESENQALGTINFAARAPHAYTQDDLRIGYLLALQLAAAIRNARRFTEMQWLYAGLRRAEQMRDDLTNMIVHDLANPLNVITGSLQLAQSIAQRTDAPAHVQQKLLENALAAGKRMEGLIKDILNVSRLEAQQLQLNWTWADVAELLRERMPAYHTQAQQEDKQITLEIAPDLPLIPLDVQLIGRVVDNLLSNAFKYTLSGGRIHIAAALTGAGCRIAVSDDGQGIPAAHHTRIFDKFHQVTDTQGQSLRSGTGLGLAFCRLAVEAHGGRIWVESQPGQGSSFYLTLPLNSAQLNQEPSE